MSYRKLPKVELLMILEQMRSRTGSDRYRAAIKQAEDIIRSAEGMKACLRDGRKAAIDVVSWARNEGHDVAVEDLHVWHDSAWPSITKYIDALPEKDIIEMRHDERKGELA